MQSSSISSKRRSRVRHFPRLRMKAPILSSRYGRPPKGSRTEQRGIAAQAHIQQEVRYLCEIIKTIGEPTGDTPASVYEITFKQLFDVGSRYFVRTTIRILTFSSIQIFPTNSSVFSFAPASTATFIFPTSTKFYFKTNMITWKLLFFTCRRNKHWIISGMFVSINTFSHCLFAIDFRSVDVFYRIENRSIIFFAEQEDDEAVSELFKAYSW